jgi:hypothetical protein
MKIKLLELNARHDILRVHGNLFSKFAIEPIYPYGNFIISILHEAPFKAFAFPH